eukprot:CCRYP_007385-RA/>CCRYP_007385-RA protein AED:0.01 eAED:0.01 QI:41/1/1/1/1/1/2/2078/257
MMVFSALAPMGAVAAALCFSSFMNMIEMYQTLQQHHQRLPPSSQSATHNERMSRASVSLPTNAKQWKSVSECLTELREMPRRELIELFLQCENPKSLAFFHRNANKQNMVYDGYLLDNGPILTHVTNFITNTLFGRGQKWLGKVYFEPDGSDAISKGQNRFLCKQGERLDCTFDCYVGPSALFRDLSSTQQPHVIINDYAPHKKTWFPSSFIWGGMVDELRMIPIQSGQKVILLGMGYFSWSGGVWNAAPFCLVARS